MARNIHNQWARVKITDKQVKKLVQIAIAPNKETLQKLQTGEQNEFSSVFNNIVENVIDYSATSPTQLMDTTNGTLFGVYNGVTGYFQNVISYKDTESKFKSIMTGNALGKAQITFDLRNEFAKVGVNALN